MSRTEKGSKGRERHRLKVAKLSYGMLRKHGKIKDIRTDFLHKLSTDLVEKYDIIVLEYLNVSGMVKNRKER
nr:transposase [Okeania sp. SIO2C9]